MRMDLPQRVDSKEGFIAIYQCSKEHHGLTDCSMDFIIVEDMSITSRSLLIPVCSPISISVPKTAALGEL